MALSELKVPSEFEESPHGKRLAARRVVGIIALIVVLSSVFFGIPGWTTYIAATAILTGITATGINMTLGSAGLLNLGAGFYFALGGYGAGLLAHFFGLPIVVALIASVLASMLVAVPFGWLLVQLPRFYFAVATLGLTIALSGLVAALPGITGGSMGLLGGGNLDFGIFSVHSYSFTAWYFVALVAMVPTLIVAKGMTRGRRARAYAIIRQDELTASSLGIPVNRMKVEMFVASAGVMAFGGGLLFDLQHVVTPDNAGVTQSMQLLGFAVVGGLTSPYGAMVGAVILIWLQSLISGFGNLELLIYGGCFVVVILFFREGLVGVWQRFWHALWRDSRTSRSLASPRLEASPGPINLGIGTVASVAAVEEAFGGVVQPAHLEDGKDLTITDLRRAFGGVVAVDGATFSVPCGSVTAVIGQNGAGKSTLMNLISGFELPDRGTVLLGSTRIERRRPEYRARLGILRTFQVPRLVETENVVENVMLGAEFCRADARSTNLMEEFDARRATWGALELLDLTAVAWQEARTLSGGHRKQVEFARALVGRPVQLILDEPAVGLDISDVDKLARIIRNIAEAGSAVLIVDHNIDFVKRVADQIWVMDAGHLSPLHFKKTEEPGDSYSEQVPTRSNASGGEKRQVEVTFPRTEAMGTVLAHFGSEMAADDTEQVVSLERTDDELQVIALRTGYGGLTVLHDIEFRVHAGELVLITGPNGAGKSTLLNAIAGSARLQAGEIWFRGRRVDALAAYERVSLGIALVPEGRQIFQSISVRANLDVPVSARGISRPNRSHGELRDQMFEMFPSLAARQHQLGGMLSGGEQQMLAIARALMCQPSLLLLDEPMQGIAPALREELAEHLQTLAGSVTMIVAEPESTLSPVGQVIELRMGRVKRSQTQTTPRPSEARRLGLGNAKN